MPGEAKIEEEIEGFARAHHLPGLALTLVDGESATVYTTGRADRERKIPVAAGTRFRTGSWTKLLTAIVALQLRERNEVDLDASIIQWIPELSRAGWARTTTLRHLLTHASGLPRGSYRSQPWTEPELLQLADRCEPVAAAGRVRKYSNLGFAIAAVLLGRAAGRSLAASITEGIFLPLGLGGSRIETAGVGALGDGNSGAVGYQAGHYRSLVSSADTLRPAHPLAEMPGAGGFLTTGQDLGLLLRAVLDRDRGLLTEESWNELLTEQPPPESAPFGLGLRIRQRWGARFFWHSGGAAGFSTFWSLCPESGVAAAAMANRCGAETSLSRLLDQLLRPRLLPAFLRPRPRPISAHAKPPRWPLYTGRYRLAGHEIEILRAGASLVLRDAESQTTLLPWRRHRFLPEGGPYGGLLLRFREEQGLIFEGFLGPWHLVRSSPFAFLFQQGVRPPRRLLTSRARVCAGTYQHPDVGPVEVYLRPSGLAFSFSLGEESALEPLGGARYRIRGGTFAGELARFRFSGGLPVALEAGLLRFERQSPPAGRALPEW